MEMLFQRFDDDVSVRCENRVMVCICAHVSYLVTFEPSKLRGFKSNYTNVYDK